jgi:fermentation-respiration switch protein FrsA (DUF1100 family)
MKRTRVGGILLGALAVAAAVAVAGRRPIARGYEAALVLEALGHAIAGSDAPTRLAATTPAPVRTTVGYTIDGRSHVADVYRRGDQPLAGIVLLHGAHRMGKDEPRLVRFATALARARFAALVPDLPVLRGREMRAGLARDVADALAYLATRPDLAPEGRAGIGAFSLAVGPAILGALEPDVRDAARFVLGVGGYRDLPRTLVYFTTGFYWTDEGPRYLEPSPDLKWLFVLAMLWTLEGEPDRATLGALAGRKAADPQAPVADLAAQLGPEGQAVYRFVTSRHPVEALGLLDQLPGRFRAALAELNLANRDLSRLAARLILVHGRDDNIIPYTESVALARAVRPGHARLFLLDRFAHIEAAPGWLDGWRMWRAVDALLAERRPP